jgi:branched-chain amino acid transport system permease protein
VKSLLRPRTVVLVVVLAVLVVLPLQPRSLGQLLPGPTSSSASLQLLAIMMVTAALAVTMDLMIGYTGYIPFGHAMYFALGAYLTVLLTNKTSLGFVLAVVVAVLASAVVALVANGLALRSSHIGYAMVTLAFLLLVSTAVERGYFGSGGENGVIMETAKMPSAFRTLDQTRNVYWLALGLLVVVVLVVGWLVRTRLGAVWIAVRENRDRAAMIGYDTYLYVLAATVVASGLAALCGAAYALAIRGAEPSITTLFYSLGIVLMVALGGRGMIWGAVVGGLIYSYLTIRMPGLASGSTVESLPSQVRFLFEEPEFVLGLVLTAAVVLFPQGIVGGVRSLGARRWGRRTPGRRLDATAVPGE